MGLKCQNHCRYVGRPCVCCLRHQECPWECLQAGRVSLGFVSEQSKASSPWLLWSFPQLAQNLQVPYSTLDQTSVCPPLPTPPGSVGLGKPPSVSCWKPWLKPPASPFRVLLGSQLRAGTSLAPDAQPSPCFSPGELCCTHFSLIQDLKDAITQTELCGQDSPALSMVSTTLRSHPLGFQGHLHQDLGLPKLTQSAAERAEDGLCFT